MAGSSTGNPEMLIAAVVEAAIAQLDAENAGLEAALGT